MGSTKVRSGGYEDDETDTMGMATYFARQYSDCRLLPLNCVLLQNTTFELRRNLLGIA